MTLPAFSPQLNKWLKLAIILVAGFYAALFVGMVVIRLLYPYEIEFMEGVVADHSVRLIEGLPIYAKPDLSFVALLYPPLYYYASAAIMEIVGVSLFAPRLVSLLATLGTCSIIYIVIHRLVQDRWSALMGVAIFIAGYGVTGYFYDAARVDALFVFLILAAVHVLLSARSHLHIIAASVFFAIAFFTKQQSLMFAGVAALWLSIKSWKQFGVFMLSLAVLIFGGIFVLDQINDGWFSYFVFGIPTAKRAEFNWYSFLAIFPDEAINHWGLATLAIVTWMFVRSKEKLAFVRSSEGLLAATFLCAVLAMMLSYGNLGGYRNVTMPMVAMMAIVLPLALKQLEVNMALTSSFGSLLLLLQLTGLWITPLWGGMMFSSQANKAAGDRFIADLGVYPGPVLLPSHGFLAHLAGKPMHFHEVSYADAILMKDEHARDLKSAYDSALASKYYSAIIIDELPAIRPDSIPGYTLAGRAFQEPALFSSKLLDVATRPQYIYLPR